MSLDRITEKENYMGKISWSRMSCGSPINLFGTDIKTDHPISIRISEASVERCLSRDWYHSGKSIVEVELSPVQWAEFLTSGNTEGIPCTIKSRSGERMDEVPYSKILEHYDSESQAAFDSFKESYDNLEAKIKDVLESGKPMGKKQMEDLLYEIEISRSNTVANLEYVKTSFKEDLADVVVHAKAEVNAFVETKAIELGLQDLKNNIQLSIGDTSSDSH